MAIKILSTSGVLPKKVLTNADLEKIVDTSNEWIVKMTGIKERHVLSGAETFTGCAHQAALAAIKTAGIPANDIDLIVLGTSTAEQLVPSSASIVQGKLGIKKSIAYDVAAGCSGFVYALTNAYYFMQGNPNIRHALVLGCDALSTVTDWTDRGTCVLLGDGFGAMLLGRNEEPPQKGIYYCDIGSDSSGKAYLEVPWGIGQGYAAQANTKLYLLMNGPEVYKSAVTYFTQMIHTALEKNNLTMADIDWVIPHQANIRIIQAVAERLQVPMEKFVITLDKHGNTSAASIPMAFAEIANAGKLNRGDVVLMAGFGAGYTWGAVIAEY